VEQRERISSGLLVSESLRSVARMRGTCATSFPRAETGMVESEAQAGDAAGSGAGVWEEVLCICGTAGDPSADWVRTSLEELGA